MGLFSCLFLLLRLLFSFSYLTYPFDFLRLQIKFNPISRQKYNVFVQNLMIRRNTN